MTFRPMPALAVIATLMSVAAPAVAASDPAAQRVEALDDALLAAMKSGKAAGAHARYDRLLPVVERSFDLPVMTAYAVGPAWSTFSEADKTALVRAFTKLSAASYAHNFDSYSGERFEHQPDGSDARRRQGGHREDRAQERGAHHADVPHA